MGAQGTTGWTESRMRIEDHALIGDLHSAALVAKDGSISFACLPDFDSDACFASLLGTPDNGRWRIAPLAGVKKVERRYRPGTLVLETDFHTGQGVVRIVDFMPVREGLPHIVRIVQGLEGNVAVRHELRPRFGNGWTIPRVSRRDGTFGAVAGPDALYLRGAPDEPPPPFEADVMIGKGQRIPFVLSWARPYHPIPEAIDADAALRETMGYWTKWSSTRKLPGQHADVVLRSLITLKACTYRPSGAIVAAPTFGLPETPGGERNWDYRYCWVRDSVLTLRSLMASGDLDDAQAFGQWLVNAVGGAPSQFQIMYGIRGERRLTEVELPWLSGHGGARPVRIGNAAYDQFQLDVFGELADVMYLYTRLKGSMTQLGRDTFAGIVEEIARVWKLPDHGIWEMRGPKHAFTASRVAAWSAVDSWIRVNDELGLEIDRKRWVALRKEIFDEILRTGYDPKRNTFTQYIGSKGVDASLLYIPATGFLPVDDPRVVGTVAEIEKQLLQDGLLLRYRTEEGVDGLVGEEGVFLACSFWLATTYNRMGRRDEAVALFERLVGLQNDVGLLAEEYLPSAREQIGNFPQAFSHLALVTCAYELFGGAAAALHRDFEPVPIGDAHP